MYIYIIHKCQWKFWWFCKRTTYIDIYIYIILSIASKFVGFLLDQVITLRLLSTHLHSTHHTRTHTYIYNILYHSAFANVSNNNTNRHGIVRGKRSRLFTRFRYTCIYIDLLAESPSDLFVNFFFSLSFCMQVYSYSYCTRNMPDRYFDRERANKMY